MLMADGDGFDFKVYEPQKSDVLFGSHFHRRLRRQRLVSEGSATLFRMTDILAAIDAEIAALQHARALIAGATTTIAKRGPGRPKGTGKKKRRMSEEGRARLVAAVKARWARQKKAAK